MTSTSRRIEIVRMIGAAWEAAGVSVDCEICKQSDWLLVAGEDTDGAAISLRRGDQVDHANCFLIYSLQCKNCGNVRMMSKSRIEELAGVDGPAEAD
jgi:hypothetical protein